MSKCDAIAISNELAPQVPEWTLLVPFGNPVRGDNGDFIVDRRDAESIVNSFTEHGTDMLVDYRHLSLRNQTADDGKAAGWIKEMKLVENSGVMGRIDWTNKARTAIAAKEFRYLSPVVMARKSTGRAIAINTCGLTNTPAIKGMVPIVNSALFGKESEMDAVMQALRELLGLGADATEEQILAGLTALKEKMTADTAAVANSSKLLKLLGDELKIATDGDVEAISNSVRSSVKSLRDAASNDAAKLATEALKQANDRLAALEKKLTNDEWDTFVTANSRKIPPAQVDAYRKLWEKDREALVAIVNSSPNLVDDAASAAGKRTATGAVPANDRVAIINESRNKFRADPDLAWGGRTEREFVAGELAAAGQAKLTADEAAKFAIIG